MRKKNFRGGGDLDREGGDKRHGYNSNAIAKLLKIIFLIVTLVIKVIEYVKKKNNNNMLSNFGL